jgi:hypothetical protein
MAFSVHRPILARVLRLKTAKGTGSCSYFCLAGRSVLLTAYHLAEGVLPGDRVCLKGPDGWFPVEVRAVSSRMEGHDVAALELVEALGEGLLIDDLGAAGMVLGDEVRFCGFPLNLELEAGDINAGWPLALVKGGIWSGTIKRAGVPVELFDGYNNNGFSGGPVVWRNQQTGDQKIVGVISGYLYDSNSHVHDDKSERLQDYYVKPNSGFVMVASPMATLRCLQDIQNSFSSF